MSCSDLCTKEKQRVPPDGYFKDKSVLITGAAHGLGAALAQNLAGTCAQLLLLDIDEAALKKTALLCSVDPTFVQYRAVDLRSAQLVEQAYSELGPDYLPDVIIANAGVGGINPANAFSTEINETVMGINFFGTINTVAPFLQRMCDRKSGHIVAISSLASLRGLPAAASYCASKAAQNSLMESWRLDLARFNIHVSTILPGFIKTAMADHDEFDMPFTVSSDAAAQATLKAIAKKKKRYLFPWSMRFLASLNSMLPIWLYDFLIPRLNRDAAKSEAKLFSAQKKL